MKSTNGLSKTYSPDALAAAGARGDLVLAGGLTVPGYVARQLLPYQVEGVRWLWGLHSARVGGVLGDEMGLGKTVQVAALLGALKHSGLLRRPSPCSPTQGGKKRKTPQSAATNRAAPRERPQAPANSLCSTPTC